jgi:hypothetical protein
VKAKPKAKPRNDGDARRINNPPADPYTKLKTTCVVYGPLLGEIFVARFGKKPGLALDKRIATLEVLGATVEHMMHNAPKGADRDIHVKGRGWFTLSVRPRLSRFKMTCGDCGKPYLDGHDCPEGRRNRKAGKGSKDPKSRGGTR